MFKKYLIIRYVILFTMLYLSSFNLAYVAYGVSLIVDTKENELNTRIAYLTDGYYKISNKSSDKVMKIKDALFSNGAEVVLSDFVYENNEIFFLRSFPDKSYSISPCHSNLSLGIDGYERFIQTFQSDVDSEKFYLQLDYKTGFYKIVSKFSNKALESNLDGFIYEKEISDIYEQLWEFEKLDNKNAVNPISIEEGYYKILDINLDKVLEVSGFNYGVSDVLENTWNGENNQIFYFFKLEDGSFCIKASHSDMYLKYSLNKRLNVEPWKDDLSQKFYIDKYDDNKYALRSKLSDKNISTEDILENQDTQLFSLIEVPKNPNLHPKDPFIENGYYRIENDKTLKNLNVKDFSLDNGAHLTENDFNKINNEIFYFEHLESNKYLIKAAHSDKAIEISDNSSLNGAIIQQWDFLNNDNQKFYLEPYGNSFKLRASNSGKLITVAEEKVFQNEENDEFSQLFKLKKEQKSEFNTKDGKAPPPPPPPFPTSHRLDVPLIPQRPELPTGCEITAITMMLRYSGANVNKVNLAKEMPKSNNPNFGYVGNPFLFTGWTIYPPALTPLVRKYANSAINLTGCTPKTLEEQIVKNKPVVVWVSGMYGFGVHALVLTGFDEAHYFFNDPWIAKKDMPMKKKDFLYKWNLHSKRAMSY